MFSHSILEPRLEPERFWIEATFLGAKSVLRSINFDIVEGQTCWETDVCRYRVGVRLKKVQGKAVPVHAMKSYRRSRGIATFILNLGTRRSHTCYWTEIRCVRNVAYVKTNQLFNAKHVYETYIEM